jgi:hypothetical protein
MEPRCDRCGGGSICMGKWTLGLNKQCRQWFLRRIIHVNHEIWNGTGKSAGSSSFCMSTDVPCRSCHSAGMEQHGWDPWVSPGTRCLWWIVGIWSWVKPCIREMSTGDQPAYNRVGMRGRGEGQWLAWITRLGPTPRKCGQERFAWLCSKASISHG